MADQETVALRALALSGVMSGLHMLRLMASRGLVSPQEVGEFFDGITGHFDLPDDDPNREYLAQWGELLDRQVSGPLAELRQIAEERWIGRQP